MVHLCVTLSQALLCWNGSDQVYNDLIFAADEGKVSALALLDLSSAFDGIIVTLYKGKGPKFECSN